MDEKQLKTSLWQRIVIVLVAALLIGSTVLTYMFIVMSNTSGRQNSEERVAELEAEYDVKGEELEKAAEPIGMQYLDELKSYQKQVKSFNAASANAAKIQTNDLKVGTGKELKEGDSEYMAYYIGWCPDGSVFDSSFDYAEDDTDKRTPIKLKQPLINNEYLIEGWKQAVVGMKLGGVRWASIPGELAYGEQERCGMENAPLRYVIMALETDSELARITDERNDIWLQIYTALMGSGN